MNRRIQQSYELSGQRFQWDSNKAAANLRKHGVSFEVACEVFFDPFLRLFDAEEDGESREAAIGFTEEGSLLFVVHLVQDVESIRIISARNATATERRHYEDE